MFIPVTGWTSDPLYLLALKMVFLFQSVQYIQSSKRVMLKGWFKCSVEYITTLEKKGKERGKG